MDVLLKAEEDEKLEQSNQATDLKFLCPHKNRVMRPPFLPMVSPELNKLLPSPFPFQAGSVCISLKLFSQVFTVYLIVILSPVPSCVWRPQVFDSRYSQRRSTICPDS
jgi:hypothetical protein